MMNSIANKQLLETAWRRYAALDVNAIKLQNQYLRLRKAMAVLGVLAVLLAILVDSYLSVMPPVFGIVLRALLILTPIAISVIAAFGNKFMTGQKYISYRAAAEAILKEIYLYRTANRNLPNREKILSERLAAIQRDLFRGVGGELVLEEYTGPVPPYRSSDDSDTDDGFRDLDGDEYLALRLEDQLRWHQKKNLQLQRQRKLFQWGILLFSAIGAFFAAWAGSLALWVALTAAMASALVGWEELRGLELRVTNYSQVVLELNILRDWWHTLPPEERTAAAAATLARRAENILFDKNLEWANAMRRTLADAESEDAALIESVIAEGRETTQRLQSAIYAEAAETFEESFAETAESLGQAIATSGETMRQMFAGMTAIDEDELDAPPEESPDEVVNTALDEGSAQEPFLPGDQEEAYAPRFEEGEAVALAAEAEAETFDDVGSEATLELDEDVFIDEDFSDDEELEAEGDMHEVWDD